MPPTHGSLASSSSSRNGHANAAASSADDQQSLHTLQQNVTSVVTEMYSLFLCPLCTSIYSKPVVLPCTHTFCEDCLDAWSEARKGLQQCPNKQCGVPYMLRDIHFNTGLTSIISSYLPYYNHVKQQGEQKVAVTGAADKQSSAVFQATKQADEPVVMQSAEDGNRLMMDHDAVETNSSSIAVNDNDVIDLSAADDNVPHTDNASNKPAGDEMELPPPLEYATLEMDDISNTPATVSPEKPSQPAVMQSQTPAVTIVFTGVTDDKLQQLQQYSQALGFTIVSQVSDRVTHIVCQEIHPQSASQQLSQHMSQSAVRRLSSRTTKYLLGLLLGKHIVSTDWLDECYARQHHVNEDHYTINGDLINKHYNAAWKSRQRIAQNIQQKLFHGWQFYLLPPKCYAARDPPVSDLSMLIRAGDGQLAELPDDLQQVLSLKPAFQPLSFGSTDENKQPLDNGANHCVMLVWCAATVYTISPLLRQQLSATATEHGIRCISAYWLFDCISRYEMLPLEKYDMPIASAPLHKQQQSPRVAR